MTFQPPQTLADIPTVAQFVAKADETVAGLQKEKMRIAWILRRHLVAGFRGVRSSVPNLLVIGPTGGGKTHLLTSMLSAAPVPWAEINVTEYSDVGYIGRDLTTMYTSLIAPRWAGDKKVDEQAWTQREMIGHAQQYGVLLLDEFDKLRMISKPGERQVGRALQAELLKLVEGGEVEVKRYDGDRGFTFRTHGVLHVAMGAFEGLNRVMAEIDKTDNPTEGELLTLHMEVEAFDIAKYGFIPELVGRFACLLPLPHLDNLAMMRILEEQVIPRYREEMEMHGIHFDVDPGATGWIAGEVARHGKSGARSIVPIMEELTWEKAALAQPGDTVALTASSVQQRGAELRHGEVAA
jgi:ATP-dependent Clp protease ATP-binding subunit ClpX